MLRVNFTFRAQVPSGTDLIILLFTSLSPTPKGKGVKVQTFKVLERIWEMAKGTSSGRGSTELELVDQGFEKRRMSGRWEARRRKGSALYFFLVPCFSSPWGVWLLCLRQERKQRSKSYLLEATLLFPLSLALPLMVSLDSNTLPEFKSTDSGISGRSSWKRRRKSKSKWRTVDRWIITIKMRSSNRRLRHRGRQ